MAGEEYRALVAKVESFVAAVGARRASDLACKRGCDGCCHAWLSVSAVEAEAVRAGLAALPAEARQRVRARGVHELAREHEGPEHDRGPPRCALLEDDGSCAVYAARPLVCRTQGHALRYPPDFIPAEAVQLRTKAGDVTWCPLNYREAAPRAEDVLDAERVDQILALVGQRRAASAEAALERTSLSRLAAEG
ncbi:MAG TPA: YkgJ family cysteine cluster protein [Polyangiales bacterium]